ncbi:MAG: hypothetical protein H6867_06820 [Rhodospirillales bacterium]|nr:hypothetical protein [Rhodospirillales bacterium]MCB9995262.1 hypothetical protein [Rhodospirillales bacterium]
MSEQNNDSAASSEPSDNIDPKEDAFFRALAKRKEQDPLAGVKMGALEITNRLVSPFNQKGEGVHIESLITLLSALAGFACQMAIREAVIKSGKAAEKDVFHVIKAADNQKYFMGGLLNRPLIEDRLSIWHLVGGILHETGTKLPDLAEIATYSTQSIGTENFGIPRVSQEQHKSGDTAQNYIRDLWPLISPLADKFCGAPAEKPILLGIALQDMIRQGKDVLDPATAAIIAMDTAVAMSKIDPESVNISI